MSCLQSESINSKKVDNLFKWLNENGATGLDQMEIKPSPECNGSIGCFAKIEFKKGDILAKIPKKCILGLGQAIKSPLISQLNEYAQKEYGKKLDKQVFSNEFMLWIYEGQCLIEEKDNHWKSYLESLPSESPIVCSWDENILQKISKTNLGSAVEKEQAIFQKQIEFLQSIQSKYPDLLHPEVTKYIEWSKGNYLSRRFVGKLAIDGEGQGLEQYGGKMGCMVPFFDLLNHKNDHKVNFQHDEEYVWYVCEYDIKAGEEVFNNYCKASNEELLFTYGFAVENNQLDVLPLKLMACDKKGKPKEIGVFKVKKQSQGGIPKELFQAMTGEEDISQLYPEEVDMLLKMVKQKQLTIEDAIQQVQSLLVDGKPTDVKIEYLMHYLNGQQEIITESITQLKSIQFEEDDQYEYH
ncbi:hypothetical protein ABPG74_011891 [Tetrahymena malaccensis]